MSADMRDITAEVLVRAILAETRLIWRHRGPGFSLEERTGYKIGRALTLGRLAVARGLLALLYRFPLPAGVRLRVGIRQNVTGAALRARRVLRKVQVT